MGESHGKRDPRERHAATRFGHLSRTKDDVCDDDKVDVMQAPTCESLTLKRVEINAVKTETLVPANSRRSSCTGKLNGPRGVMAFPTLMLTSVPHIAI